MPVMKRSCPGRAFAPAALMMLASVSWGQLTPDRTYYGVGRAVPMTIAVPAGTEGEVRVTLNDAATGKEIARADAAPGGVNMATLFPQLWGDKPRQVLLAQLRVGETEIGAPVVLQPMVPPQKARAAPGGPVQFSPQGMVYSGLRAYTDRHVVLDTTSGEIRIALRPDAAPNTAWNFRGLVEGGFYTDIAFHRIIPALPSTGKPFVAQAGDPGGVGSGGCGFHIDLEPSTLPHDFGVISMARSGDPDSGGSQFFLCLSRDGTAFLDGSYTSFGQIVSGGAALILISKAPLEGERPKEPMPRIITARLADAPPLGARPAPVTREQAEQAMSTPIGATEDR